MILAGDTVPCPADGCGLDAEVTEDWQPPSSPGPFSNAYATFCPAGHRFHGLVEA